jgi:branched-chain amino acid aminotransferase
VGVLGMEDKVITIGNGEVGGFSSRLADALNGIQYGKIADELGWTVEVELPLTRPSKKPALPEFVL